MIRKKEHASNIWIVGATKLPVKKRNM
jgi:hypothetical protein